MNDRTPILVTPTAARIAALVLIVLCLALLSAEFFYERHPYFGFDGVFAIHALVGFVSVIGAVLLARLLRPMIGRRPDYYGEADPDVHELDGEGRSDD